MRCCCVAGLAGLHGTEASNAKRLDCVWCESGWALHLVRVLHGGGEGRTAASPGGSIGPASGDRDAQVSASCICAPAEAALSAALGAVRACLDAEQRVEPGQAPPAGLVPLKQAAADAGCSDNTMRRWCTASLVEVGRGRCRMHGGPSTGPRTVEGAERSRRADWKCRAAS